MNAADVIRELVRTIEAKAVLEQPSRDYLCRRALAVAEAVEEAERALKNLIPWAITETRLDDPIRRNVSRSHASRVRGTAKGGR